VLSLVWTRTKFSPLAAEKSKNHRCIGRGIFPSR
jgi:hypothetical protein